MDIVRTTVILADDVVAEVRRLQREQGLGVSDAVNLLARVGMRRELEPAPFHQRTAPMGLRSDVTNVAMALEILDAPRT